MVKVVRREGTVEIYARCEAYPHADMSYVDIFQGTGASAHLLGRLPPMTNDVAEAVAEAINGPEKVEIIPLEPKVIRGSSKRK